MQQNIDRNAAVIAAAGGCATAAPCAWGQPIDPLDDVPPPSPQASGGGSSVGDNNSGGSRSSWREPDLLVAADVVYHRELFGLLLKTLGE